MRRAWLAIIIFITIAVIVANTGDLYASGTEDVSINEELDYIIEGIKESAITKELFTHKKEELIEKANTIKDNKLREEKLEYIKELEKDIKETERVYSHYTMFFIFGVIVVYCILGVIIKS